MMAAIIRLDDALDVTNGLQSQILFRVGADGAQPAESRFYFRQRQRP
jgi:hypothetical protein